MVDYSVDSGFDIHTNKNDQLVEVDGLEEFQEDLIIQIDDRFGDLIGSREPTNTLKEKITLLASRFAKEYGEEDQIRRIAVTEPIDKPETLSVEIFYSTGERFQETI